MIGPALAAVVVVFLATGAQRRLPPALATWMITVLAVLGSGAAVIGAGVVSLSWLAAMPWLAERVGWCRSFAAAHDAPPAWLGALATAALAAMLCAVTLAVWRDRRRHNDVGPPGVAVLALDEPVAFAAPGGAITVSTGMLRRLDAGERRALFAHERSHAAHHHHRFLRIVQVTSTAAPFLWHLRHRIRFATERWADEDAARFVGDRCVVARAIAHAALATAAPSTVRLGLATFGVVDRVQALLADEGSIGTPPAPAVVAVAVAVVVGLAGSGFQAHHFLAVAGHVCGL